MHTILIIIGIWLALQLPAGVLVGRFIRFGSGEESSS